MEFIEYLAIVIIFLGLIFMGIGLYCMDRAEKIKIKKETKQLEELERLTNEIESLYQSKTKLDEDIAKEKQKINDLYEKEKNKISEELKVFQDNSDFAKTTYIDILEKEYDKAELNFQYKVASLLHKKEEVENNIKDAESHFNILQNQINAATKAQLREREKEEKADFYKLCISAIDLNDIQKLESTKLTLHNPVVLSKLIWSTYFQKQATEMCNRIFGTKQLCGIYKITNLKTKQCYVGQSVNIQDRIKQHIKCGLGIDASISNKLYNAMQKDGVWNFTFELLEECPREKLNEREAFWIKLYESDKIGLNSTKGNK